MATSLAVRVVVLITIQTVVVSSHSGVSHMPCYYRRRLEEEGYSRGMGSNEYVHRDKIDIKSYRERAEVDIMSHRERPEVDIKSHRERPEVDIKSHRERAEVDIKAHRERPEVDIKAHRERAEVDIKAHRERAEVEIKSPRVTKQADMKSAAVPMEVDGKSPPVRNEVDINSSRLQKEVNNKSLAEGNEVEGKLFNERKENDSKSRRIREEIDSKSHRLPREVDNKSSTVQKGVDGNSKAVWTEVGSKSLKVRKEANNKSPTVRNEANSKSPTLRNEADSNSFRVLPQFSYINVNGKSQVTQNSVELLHSDVQKNESVRSKRETQWSDESTSTNSDDDEMATTRENLVNVNIFETRHEEFSTPRPGGPAPPPQFSTPRPSAPALPPLFSAHRPSPSSPPPLLSAPRPGAPVPPPQFSTTLPSTPAPPPQFSTPLPSAPAPPLQFSTPLPSAPAPPPLFSTPRPGAPVPPIHLFTPLPSASAPPPLCNVSSQGSPLWPFSPSEHNSPFHHLPDPPSSAVNLLEKPGLADQLPLQLPSVANCNYSGTLLLSIQSIHEEIISNPSFSPENFLQSVCPLQFCDNQTFFNDIQNPCCVVCDCTRNCPATDSCCDDKDAGKVLLNDTHGAADNQAVCTPPALLLSAYYNVWGIQTYKMVTLCSPQYTDSMFPINHSRKCESPEEMTLENLTPVHHKETGITYRNIHCAVCNFAYGDVEQWSPRMECYQEFETNEIFYEFSNFTDIVNRAMEIKFCDIVWHPGNVDSEACFEQEDIVSACQTIGNSLVEDLCRKFSAPFRYNGIIYKNLFCVVCNFHTTEEAYLNSCDDGNENTDFRDKFVGNINLAALEAGRTVRELETMYDQRNNSCRHGFEMNEYIMACVRATCPTSMINVSGVCQPVLDQVAKIGLHFLLTLGYTGFIPRKDSTKFDARQFLPHNLTSCAEGLSEPKVENGTVYITYYNIMYTNSLLNVHDIYMDFEKRVQANNDMQFTVEIGGKCHYPFIIEHVGYIQYEYSSLHDCPSAIAMSELQFCDAILIDSHDYDVNNGTLFIDGIVLQPSDFVLRPTRNQLLNASYIQACADRVNDVINQLSWGNERYGGKEDSTPDLRSAAATGSSGMAVATWTTVIIVHKF